jgi:hypothetical protein
MNDPPARIVAYTLANVSFMIADNLDDRAVSSAEVDSLVAMLQGPIGDAVEYLVGGPGDPFLIADKLITVSFHI